MGKHAFWMASFQCLTKSLLWDQGEEITEAIFSYVRNTFIRKIHLHSKNNLIILYWGLQLFTLLVLLTYFPLNDSLKHLLVKLSIVFLSNTQTWDLLVSCEVTERNPSTP